MRKVAIKIDLLLVPIDNSSIHGGGRYSRIETCRLRSESSSTRQSSSTEQETPGSSRGGTQYPHMALAEETVTAATRVCRENFMVILTIVLCCIRRQVDRIDYVVFRPRTACRIMNQLRASSVIVVVAVQ